MIEISDLYKKYFFTVKYEGETVLAYVACKYEYEVMIICSECEKKETIKHNKVFDYLESVWIQMDSDIERWDKKVLSSIEKQVLDIFAHDLCYSCHEEKEKIERKASMPINPLGI